MFPTADQIATAIVTACRLTDCNPVLTALGQEVGEKSRGRHVALASLIEAFPEARKASLARCCGYQPVSRSAAASNLTQFRRGKWWNEDWIDEIVGALVADQYEDAA